MRTWSSPLSRCPLFTARFIQSWANTGAGTKIINSFQVKSARVGEGIRTLSGGNLQKIVLGRELNGSPKLVIVNQPTRGLDVGSIEFVHKTLIEARDTGAAVLLISVELEIFLPE